jgi:hypothetical protein
MNLSGTKVLWWLGVFLGLMFVFNNMPDDVRQVALPVLIFAGFVRAAIKSPPIAIAILLYYSMILGGWLILAAAPVSVLLARRYQRQRLDLELTPIHIRRTVLLAMGALVATLPFIAASLGPWSARGQSSAGRSASPLVPQGGSAEEGALQRFARWLGFGDEGGQQPGDFERLQPVPVRPPEPDDAFNWWIVVAVVVIVALLLLAWWLWRRRSPRPELAPAYETARPLARLEAVGESIGRPRAPFEGAITYGRELARRTGDPRLAAAGPLVSSQVYESAFVNPREVDANLAGIEAAPPPAPPRPPLAERMRAQMDRSPISPQLVLISLLAIAAIVIAAWIVIPRLGDLDDDGFELALQFF